MLFFYTGIIWSKAAIDLQKSANGYTLEFEVPYWQIEEVDTLGLTERSGYAGELFSRIRIPDYKYMDDVGKPQLPVFTFYMAITKPDHVPTFEVLNPVEESFSLRNRYFPTQEPWLKSQSIHDRKFSINKDYYNSQGERQLLASVTKAFTIRGVPCVNVRIAPFSYNPAENKITVIKKVTLKINTPTVPKYSGLDSKTFEKFLRYMLVNFDQAVEPVSNRDRKEDYLIITAPQFESDLIDFVAFREDRYNVNMVTTYQTGVTNFEIEEYIKNVNPTPTFVLLVGDVEAIPSKGDPATDLYYSSIDSSYYPEILLGRFSVTKSMELAYIS